MVIDDEEPSRWNELISEAPMTEEYPQEFDTDCARFKEWFEGLSRGEKLSCVMDHIIKGIRVYPQLIDTTESAKIFDDLYQIYLSPFSFTMKPMLGEEKLSLTFKQFSVLHDLFDSDWNILHVPMVRSPPEYWYLYQAARLREKDHGQLIPFSGSEVVLGQPTYSVFGGVSDLAKANLRMPSGTQWSLGLKAPRFQLQSDSYRISYQLYASWPNYWNSFEKITSQTVIGLRVREAVRMAKEVAGGVEPVQTRSLMPITQEGIVMAPVTQKSALVIYAMQARVPVPYLTVNSPVAPDTKDKQVDSTPCSCGNCGVHTVDQFVPTVGVVDYVDALIEMPISLVTEPKTILVDDFYEEVRLGDTSRDSTGQLALLKNWDVMLNKPLWESYIQVDAIVAKYAGNALYDRWLDPKVDMAADFSQSHFKRLGGTRVPRTFQKFAWLYRVTGLVECDANGKYPMGREAPIEVMTALEFSGAPWGNMMALLEAGLVTRMGYTAFKGEMYNEPVYKALRSKGKQVVYDLLENSPGPTDIKSICKSLYSQAKRPGSLPEPYSIVVFDIPLHRNTATAHSGKDHSKENKMRKEQEFVDDLPLGKNAAMAEMLTYYALICDKLLARGGTLIVKVLEFWTIEIVTKLFELFGNFAEVHFYRNPYSRPSSKEIYVVGFGAASGMLNREAFFGAVARFANYIVSNLTINLVRLAQKYGKEFVTVRGICCRKPLYKKRTLMGVNEVHIYRVPRDPFRKPTLFPANVITDRLPPSKRDISGLMRRGYTELESEALLHYWGTYEKVVSLSDSSVQLFLRTIQRLKDSKGAWRVDKNVVDLVAHQTRKDWIKCALALAETGGDIVDAMVKVTDSN